MTKETENKNTRGAQRNLIFWVVFIVILIPFCWFMYQSHVGAKKIIDKLYSHNSEITKSYMAQINANEPNEIVARTVLEFDTLTNRNARTLSFIAGRTWLRFLSSAFGGILVFVGAIFILAKVESGETRIEGGSGSHSVSLLSTSPGLILTAIGALLILSPNYAQQGIGTDDRSNYFSWQSLDDASESRAAINSSSVSFGADETSDRIDSWLATKGNRVKLQDWLDDQAPGVNPFALLQGDFADLRTRAIEHFQIP
jgi:hypothetical protein